jgi:hypothetical protein
MDMKVIFLDIDGVLNHDQTRDRIGGYLGLNPGMIKRFNRIIEACPDVKIVISSTWRHSYSHGVYEDFDGLVKLLKERGLQGDIIGHTPFPVSSPPGGWLSLGHTPYRTRGAEIRLYLDAHPEVEHFLILDDATEGMKPNKAPHHDPVTDTYFDMATEIDLRPHWIQTSSANGLKDSHVGRAIKMLNTPK